MITLVSERSARRDEDTLGAFGSPTVVHFAVALLIAGVLSAPWPTLHAVALVLGAVGLGGLAYQAIVIRRARRQTGYHPVLEDWIWHVILPLVAYASALGGALALWIHATTALFAIGAAALLLLFIGIHNAWDTVTYLTLTAAPSGSPPSPGAAASEHTPSEVAAHE